MRIPAIILACALLAAHIGHAQNPPGGSSPAASCSTGFKASGDNQDIFSDTQGVDFKPYVHRVFRIIQSSWSPLIPKEVDAPFNKSGEVTICFKILPNGRLADGGMVLAGSSGDPALDRASWGAIETSLYPPLPTEFKGPYLELRFMFQYNMDRKPQAVAKDAPRPPKLPQPPNLPTLIAKIRGRS